jgi:hypothetical protein
MTSLRMTSILMTPLPLSQANFTRDFPRLAGLSVIADADVSPLQLAYLRSLVSGACYNDSSKVGQRPS